MRVFGDFLLGAAVVLALLLSLDGLFYGLFLPELSGRDWVILLLLGGALGAVDEVWKKMITLKYRGDRHKTSR